jgi:hypothetical protein
LASNFFNLLASLASVFLFILSVSLFPRSLSLIPPRFQNTNTHLTR